MSYDRVLTVNSAAASYNLTDLATIKEELGITVSTYDTLLTRWIGEESRRIADYCGRVFPAETVTETFRYVAGRGEYVADALILRRTPVISITSVTEDSDPALTTADYEIAFATSNEIDEGEEGKLYRLTGDCRSAWYALKIVVQYVGGFLAIPTSVSAACLTLLKHRWSARTRDPALRSINIQGVGEKQWWVGSTGDVGDLPPEVQAVLDRYYVVRV